MVDMKDSFGREIDYMRISITDRCNYRCLYCMPGGCEKVSMSDILTFEEIAEICRAAGALGIVNYKITGGEPLARLGCAALVKMIKDLPDTRQVTLTTNGELLADALGDLVDAGLDAVNISIDSLVPERFEYITGGGSLAKVKEALGMAIASRVRTKVNCLIQKGFNEDEITDFAALAFEKGIDVRFIEMMPVGFGDTAKGISNEDIIGLLAEKFPGLEPDGSVHGNGPAVYYHIPGKRGAVGLISAIHGMFCGSCNRIRLTSQGELRPCLCYEDSVDLVPYLGRQERRHNNDGLKRAICSAIAGKPRQHCFNELAGEAGAAGSKSGGRGSFGQDASGQDASGLRSGDREMEKRTAGDNSPVRRTRPMVQIGG